MGGECVIGYQNGYILPVVLLSISLLSIIVVDSGNIVALGARSQKDRLKNKQLFLKVACAYHQFMLNMNSHAIKDCGDVIIKIDSIKTTPCGKQVHSIISSATSDDVVLLNSLDFFARVPNSPQCRGVPDHRQLWLYGTV